MLFTAHCHRRFFALICGLFFCAAVFVVFASPAQAQIETIVGPIDTNSQDDDDDDEDDGKDLEKSKYTPDDLVATALGETTIKIRWDENAEDEDGYDIQRRERGGSWRNIRRRDKNTDSYTDRTVQAGTTYEYRVRAFDNDDETSWSNVATATTPGLSPEEVFEIEKKKAVEKAAEEVREELKEEIKRATLNPHPETPETICTLASIPPAEVDRAFRERCEELTGEDLTTDVPEEEVTFIGALLANSKMRYALAGIILFIVINNIIWHITHRTVKNRLPGEH